MGVYQFTKFIKFYQMFTKFYQILQKNYKTYDLRSFVSILNSWYFHVSFAKSVSLKSLGWQKDTLSNSVSKLYIVKNVIMLKPMKDFLRYVS